MVTITVEIFGLEEAVDGVRPLTHGFLADLLESVAAAVELQTSIRIAEEKTAPSGEAWAPWAASYAATRRKGSGLLVDTGRLLGSIAHQVFGLTAVVGTNVPYGEWLQSGTSKMPARPYIGLSEANRAELETMIGNLVGAFYR